VKLPRSPGEREHRWMHLLCGDVDVSAPTASTQDSSYEGARDAVSLAQFEALRSEHNRLSDEVIQLRALVERMAAELGISPDGSSPSA
jgi:uncharacterized protein YceH (UPF0502 family)